MSAAMSVLESDTEVKSENNNVRAATLRLSPSEESERRQTLAEREESLILRWWRAVMLSQWEST